MSLFWAWTAYSLPPPQIAKMKQSLIPSYVITRIVPEAVARRRIKGRSTTLSVIRYQHRFSSYVLFVHTLNGIREDRLDIYI